MAHVGARLMPISRDDNYEADEARGEVHPSDYRGEFISLEEMQRIPDSIQSAIRQAELQRWVEERRRLDILRIERLTEAFRWGLIIKGAAPERSPAAVIPWTDVANCSPAKDVATLVRELCPAATDVFCSSLVGLHLLRAVGEVWDIGTSYEGSILLPELDRVLRLTVTDDGWREDGGLRRFIDEDYVVVARVKDDDPTQAFEVAEVIEGYVIVRADNGDGREFQKISGPSAEIFEDTPARGCFMRTVVRRAFRIKDPSAFGAMRVMR